MNSADRNSPRYQARRFHFTIGDDESAGMDQFPAIEALPILGKDPYGYNNDYELGFALGLAYLKLRRPWPVALGEQVELDPAPDHLVELVTQLRPASATAKPAPLSTLEGFLAVVDGVIDLTLNRPDLLPRLAMKIDAMTNADLRAHCLAALNASEPPPSGFFGELEGATDGR